MAMNNDLVPNLAMRKAVKRSAMVASPQAAEIQVATPTASTSKQAKGVQIESSFQNSPEQTVAITETPIFETFQTKAAQVASVQGLAVSTEAPSAKDLSRDEIIKLASAHGLKFEGARKVFLKHTYSVTPESKALFKKYCDSLALNMQDAMEEAMQDFFKKHALEYSRIIDAKKQR